MTEVSQQALDDIYKTWVQFAPSMYEFCAGHNLEWPSAVAEWIDGSRRVPPMRDYSVQQLVVGTNSPELNFLNVYQCFVGHERDESEYYTQEELEAFSGYSAHFEDVATFMHRYRRIVHEGPVCRAKSMPQKPDVIATRGLRSALYIFDISRRREEPEDDRFRPDMRLVGHRAPGHGLEWSTTRPGYICSGSQGGDVCVWDLEGAIELFGTGANSDTANCVAQIKAHTEPVEDVSWHACHESILASCSLDQRVNVWDLRADGPQHSEQLHFAPIHSVAFHPSAVYIMATASSDKTVRAWDLRSLRKPVTTFIGHTDRVDGVKWAPFSETILLSYSHDRTVACWDMSKIDLPANPVEDDNASPSLLFRHFGHTSTVRDASFNPNAEDDWVIASVDDSNALQIWSPASTVYNDELDVDQYETEVI